MQATPSVLLYDPLAVLARPQQRIDTNPQFTFLLELSAPAEPDNTM